MTGISRLVSRGGLCTVLTLVVLGAATFGTFAFTPRPGIIEPGEADLIYGAACASNGLSGTDCTSSFNNVCKGTGGGTACPDHAQCQPDGTQCTRLGAQGNSYNCDTASPGQKCGTSCAGGCYKYSYGLLDTDGTCLGCTNQGKCGYPTCTITSPP